jgi:aryl-alcohol dehydrogenase-like predicted oxidoreductase
MRYVTVGSIGVQVSPLCFGTMSFGSEADEPTRPATGRLVENARYANRYGLDSDYVTAEKFTSIARETGNQPASLAVAWAMAHPAVTAPIIGARNLDQLDDSLAALDIDMTPELYHQIAATSTTPAPATDRTEVQTGRWT